MTGGTNETGGIIIGWLVRLVVIVGVIAVVIFEAIALLLASLHADEAVDEVARASAEAYRATRSLQVAETAAAEAAEAREVTVHAVEIDDGQLAVEVHREAQTLFLDHLPPAETIVQRGARRVTDIEG